MIATYEAQMKAVILICACYTWCMDNYYNSQAYHAAGDQGGIVSIVTRLWTEQSAEKILVGQEICLFSTTSRLAVGPMQPPIQWVPWALLPCIKWPSHEAHHSPPPSAFMAWTGTTLPFYILLSRYGNKDGEAKTEAIIINMRVAVKRKISCHRCI
jgi:hypothetical protein